jgi:hypothetical protein
MTQGWQHGWQQGPEEDPAEGLDPTGPNEWLDALLKERPALAALSSEDRNAIAAWFDRALLAGHDYGWDRCICGHPKEQVNDFDEAMAKDD